MQLQIRRPNSSATSSSSSPSFEFEPSEIHEDRDEGDVAYTVSYLVSLALFFSPNSSMVSRSMQDILCCRFNAEQDKIKVFTADLDFLPHLEENVQSRLAYPSIYPVPWSPVSSRYYTLFVELSVIRVNLQA